MVSFTLNGKLVLKREIDTRAGISLLWARVAPEAA
jgi:hypothetical protein